MSVDSRTDKNLCHYVNQPQMTNTDVQTTEMSRESVYFEQPGNSTAPTAERSVMETAETSRNSCKDRMEQMTINENIHQSSMKHHTSQRDSGVVRKKGKYGGQDGVDKYLLNQVAKHVKYDQLGAMSRDLGISNYRKITAANISKADQIYKVNKT